MGNGSEQDGATGGLKTKYSDWLTSKSFTALIKIREGQSNLLKSALWDAGNTIGKNDDVPVTEIKKLHFLRIQVLVDAHGTYSDELMLNAVFDGDRDAFLDSLCQHLAAWLWGLIQAHCDVSQATLRECLVGHSLKESAVFSSQLDGRREDVVKEANLMTALQDLADAKRAQGIWGPESSAETIRIEMRQWVLDSKNDSLPTDPRPSLSLPGHLRRLWNGLLAVADPFSGLLRDSMRKRFLGEPDERFSLKKSILWVGLALHGAYTYFPRRWFLGKVRRLEASERYEPFSASPERLAEQQQREDLKTQNPLTLVAHVRSTPSRTWILKRVLHGASSATRHLWNQGELAGISTIHYARLCQYHKGQRFLFLSDYDGSWPRYLGDFLGVGKLAVVPIFGNLRGCPMTENLFAPTKDFEKSFLQFTRYTMCATQFWYSAWPDLSAADRLRNKRLRNGLFQEQMTEEEAIGWLADL